MVINFRVDDVGTLNSVSYDENMTVENFIKDYLSKHTDYVTLDTSVYTFRTNGKILNMSKFLKKRLCEVIINNGTITLCRKQDMHYSNKIKLIIKI